MDINRYKKQNTKIYKESKMNNYKLLLFTAGLPNPSFKKQEFFVKNQELIRRFFRQKTGEKSGHFFREIKWEYKSIRHFPFWGAKLSLLSTFEVSSQDNPEAIMMKWLQKNSIRDNVNFVLVRKMDEKSVWISYFSTDNSNF